MSATNSEYGKLVIALRYYFLGKKYYDATAALELGMSIHTGTRADKITPEFKHQIEMAHYLRTLEPALTFPEQTFCVCLLHDAYEDYPEILTLDKIERQFGSIVREGVKLVSKEAGFNKDDQSGYFNQISENPISSVVKGTDRINNLGSMVGVFSKNKQKKYVKEVEDYFFPMLKDARRLFPGQEPVYENIKFILTSQISLLKEALKYE